MKQKIKNLFKNAILILGILLIFIGCSSEDSNIELSEKPLSETELIQNVFSLKNFNDSFISNNLVVDWNDFDVKENAKENTAVYEFNTSLKVKSTIQDNKQKFDVKYKVLGYKDSLDHWTFELIKFFANDDKPLNNISYFSPTGFSGTLCHYNLKGEALKLKAYKEGKFLNEFSGKKGNSSNNSTNNAYAKFPSDEGGSPGGFWMPSRTKHYTDWYSNIYGGTTFYYTHSTYDGTTYGYTWVNTSYSGNGEFHNHYPSGRSVATDNHDNEVLFEESNIYIDLTNTSKINPTEELKCFDLTKDAKLTIYVQQPRENTDDIVGPNSVGHAFIGIEQGGIVRQLGFYPESGANSAMVAVGVNYDSELRENNDYLYHVSLSKLINSSQLNTIINYIKNFPNTYNVNSFACADFAIKIGNLGGMNLPSTTVSSYTYSGRSPGQLGQEIRAMNSNSTITVTKTSGNSPNSQGTCN